MTELSKRNIQYGQKPFGYEDGNWWLFEYKFCLNKMIPNVIKSWNKDKSIKQNHISMGLYYKLSNEWIECRIDFLPKNVQMVFAKNVVLYQSMKTAIIKIVEKLLSSQEDTYCGNNRNIDFDWLEILFKYIRFDDNGYCEYNDRYKNIIIEYNKNKNKNSSVKSQDCARNINIVPTTMTKRKQQVNNNSNNKNISKNINTELEPSSKWERNSDLYDLKTIYNSKYSKNCYKSSKIQQKYLEKREKSRKYKMKKVAKNKRKRNFNKQRARNEKYKEYEYDIAEEIEDFQDDFELLWCECCLFGVSYEECSNYECRECYYKPLRWKGLARKRWKRKWDMWWEMEEEDQREQEWQLEMECLEWYTLTQSDYIFKNVSDVVFNVYLNEKYRNNCHKSSVITKKIFKRRKNNHNIKIQKMGKMKKKKYFIKNTKKSKYKNKYPTKVNHFDF